MALEKFTLDRKGVGEVLKTVFVDDINALADQIGDQVQSAVGDDVNVEVGYYTTDRGAASITIADPRGLELQATDGALTRAAAAVGLEVRGK